MNKNITVLQDIKGYFADCKEFFLDVKESIKEKEFSFGETCASIKDNLELQYLGNKLAVIATGLFAILSIAGFDILALLICVFDLLIIAFKRYKTYLVYAVGSLILVVLTLLIPSIRYLGLIFATDSLLGAGAIARLAFKYIVFGILPAVALIVLRITAGVMMCKRAYGEGEE